MRRRAYTNPPLPIAVKTIREFVRRLFVALGAWPTPQAVKPPCRTCRRRLSTATAECDQCCTDSITEDKSYARAML